MPFLTSVVFILLSGDLGKLLYTIFVPVSLFIYQENLIPVANAMLYSFIFGGVLFVIKLISPETKAKPEE